MYKHQKAFCFIDFDPLTRDPGPRWGFRLQTPFRASVCCPPHILRPDDTPVRDVAIARLVSGRTWPCELIR